MGSYDAVGNWNVLLEERGSVAVGGAVGEHTRDEPVAERLGVGREPLSPADLVAPEAVGHHGQVLPLKAVSDSGELIAGDLQPGWVFQWQRRLGEDRCEHRWLEHHRERKIAGEAHTYSADARTAALLVCQSRQRPKPDRHRARPVGAERAELGTDAGPLEGGRTLLGTRLRTVAAEQRGHVYREPCISDPATVRCL